MHGMHVFQDRQIKVFLAGEFQAIHACPIAEGAKIIPKRERSAVEEWKMGYATLDDSKRHLATLSATNDVLVYRSNVEWGSASFPKSNVLIIRMPLPCLVNDVTI